MNGRMWMNTRHATLDAESDFYLELGAGEIETAKVDMLLEN